MSESVEIGTVEVPIEVGVVRVEVSAQAGQVTIQGTLFGHSYAADIDTESAHALARLLFHACTHAGLVSDPPPGDNPGGGD